MRSFQDDQERIDTHQKEHELMKQSIEKVQSANPSTAEFDELLHGLMKQVLHHVAEEESMLLPQAEKRLSAQALHELGARMIQRKMELMSEYMKPVQRVGSFVKGNPVKSAIFGAAVIAAGVSYFQRGRRRSSFLNRL